MTTTTTQPTSVKFETASAALSALLGGNAILTLVSRKTGARYTYKVARAKAKEGRPEVHAAWFVSLMTGPPAGDGAAGVVFLFGRATTPLTNESDFTYIGTIREGGRFATTRASGLRAGTDHRLLDADAAPVKAFAWAFDRLLEGRLPETLEVWHGEAKPAALPVVAPKAAPARPALVEPVTYSFGPGMDSGYEIRATDATGAVRVVAFRNSRGEAERVTQDLARAAA